MAKDVADALGTAIGRVAREAAKNVQASANKGSRGGGGVIDRVKNAGSNGKLSGPGGLAAGAGLATLVPLVAKGAGKLVRGMGDGGGPVQKVGDKVGGKVKDAVGDQVDKAGGAGGIAKEAGKSMIPGLGGGKKQGVDGVGKGRRMPFQWDIDIGVPLDTVWEKWTDYEQWPQFMHRVQNVSQDDDETVKFKAKIWGISREFTAEICEQEEKERIKWKVTEGLTHKGVVTFHELAPRLTRVEVSFDVEPGGMIEKMARGMRHVKRAARADLARFKAYVLMGEDLEENESDDDDSSQSEEREQSSSRSSSSRPRSATKRGQSRSGSSGRSSSGGRKSSSSSGRKSSSSSGRKSSSSGGRTRASSSGQKRSASKRSSSSSSNGRSSSNRTRASSSGNGRSSSSRSGSSNGRSSSSARKRSGSRS